MARKPLLRIAAAALGGLAVATVLLAITLVVNAGGGFSGTTAATPLGWTIPLIAGVLVGGLAWLLLSDRPARGGRENPPTSIACASCGKACLDSWRLCPFCGTLLRQSSGDQ
ncbi:MAG: hypothetical protein HY876_08585 [Coriobacteriales bacterium]|nr:hypothetical protein [Coriobacteriales bacterium]